MLGQWDNLTGDFSERVQRRAPESRDQLFVKEEDYTRVKERLLEAIKSGKQEGGRSYSSPRVGKAGGDPPQIIDTIKDLPEKLKSLIPERWLPGPLRNILDKLVKNLSPQDPQEFERLEKFVSGVYFPVLDGLVEQGLIMEAYEYESRSLLLSLIEEKLSELKR